MPSPSRAEHVSWQLWTMRELAPFPPGKSHAKAVEGKPFRHACPKLALHPPFAQSALLLSAPCPVLPTQSVGSRWKGWGGGWIFSPQLSSLLSQAGWTSFTASGAQEEGELSL